MTTVLHVDLLVDLHVILVDLLVVLLVVLHAVKNLQEIIVQDKLGRL
jgi:hypothetical protein